MVDGTKIGSRTFLDGYFWLSYVTFSRIPVQSAYTNLIPPPLATVKNIELTKSKLSSASKRRIYQWDVIETYRHRPRCKL